MKNEKLQIGEVKIGGVWYPVYKSDKEDPPMDYDRWVKTHKR
jgi:hypothetical protein